MAPGAIYTGGNKYKRILFFCNYLIRKLYTSFSIHISSYMAPHVFRDVHVRGFGRPVLKYRKISKSKLTWRHGLKRYPAEVAIQFHTFRNSKLETAVLLTVGSPQQTSDRQRFSNGPFCNTQRLPDYSISKVVQVNFDHNHFDFLSNF